MPSLGIVSFNRKDIDNEYMRKIRSRAKSIEQCIDSNADVFDLLCQFILLNKTKDEYLRNFEGWEKQVRLLNETLKISNIDEFLNSVKNAYDESTEAEISDLRGRLFEVILENIYSEKYKDSRLRRCIYESGCQIVIKNKEIMYSNPKEGTSKKTVDIAGYDMRDGEFYEAKVGPGNFDSLVISYLNFLKQEASDKKICDNIIVGCMTMETRPNLMRNLMRVRLEDKVDFRGLVLIGREDIKNIICK